MAVLNQRYVEAGYTHLVTYSKFLKTLGVIAHNQSFPTTADMVERHVTSLNGRADISNVRVEVLQ